MNYNSPASNAAVRPSTKKRERIWNDLEVVATCKDTPFRLYGGNLQGNLRNERPTPCRNDRLGSSRRQIDRIKILGHPTSMGAESPVSTD